MDGMHACLSEKLHVDCTGSTSPVKAPWVLPIMGTSMMLVCCQSCYGAPWEISSTAWWHQAWCATMDCLLSWYALCSYNPKLYALQLVGMLEYLFNAAMVCRLPAYVRLTGEYGEKPFYPGSCFFIVGCGTCHGNNEPRHNTMLQGNDCLAFVWLFLVRDTAVPKLYHIMLICNTHPDMQLLLLLWCAAAKV